MRRLPVFAVFALISALLAAPGTVLAEAQTPSFSMPGVITPDEVAALSVDFDESFAQIENRYLADTLKLNYQISLLEKMVARQAELEKIAESYDAMGIPFNPPPPARGICAQLPPNAPCLKYHPDLYDTLVDQRKAYYDKLAEQARRAAEPPKREGESDEEAERRRAKEAAERAAKQAAKEREDRYRWTEVSCFGGDCRGVLVTSAQDGFRATVREGDQLFDGTKVQAISTRGIRIAIEGQVINVRPAPGEGSGGQEQSAESAALAQQLQQTMASSGIQGVMGPSGPLDAAEVAAQTKQAQGAAASVIAGASAGTGVAPTPDTSGTGTAPAATADPTSGTGGQSTMEPALGPSGLF